MEATGSNPVGALQWKEGKEIEREFDSDQIASAGHWRAPVAVTHPPKALQVQLLPDALGLWIQFVVIRPGRLAVRTPLFQSGKAGSTPVRAASEGVFVADQDQPAQAWRAPSRLS